MLDEHEHSNIAERDAMQCNAMQGMMRRERISGKDWDWMWTGKREAKALTLTIAHEDLIRAMQCKCSDAQEKRGEESC